MTDSSENATTPGSPLSGAANAAIDLAAEIAKETAGRNIPGLGELPVPDDTANLRLGPNLHDGLLALLPLVGVWRGEGQADSPIHGAFNFGQELIFAHNGHNYLSYESRQWKLDEEGNHDPSMEEIREKGFWRISEKDEIEFTCVNSLGAVEIFYGEPFSERAWQLESSSTMVTATGPEKLGPGKRLYGLMPTADLGWVDERLIDGEMKPYMSAELRRVIG